MMYTPEILYFIFLTLSAVISLYLSIYTWKFSNIPGTTLFSSIMGLGALWAVADIFELYTSQLYIKLLWSNIQFISIAVLPVLLLFLSLMLTDRQHLITTKTIVLFCIIPILSILFSWTNHIHGLIITNISLDISKSLFIVKKDFGYWFWVHSIYSYLLIITSMLLLSFRPLLKGVVYRKHSFALLQGVLFTLIANAIYLLFGSALRYDYTPVFFGITSLIMSTSSSKYKIFNIVPIAREEIIERMNTGVVVVDKEDIILDINPSAQRYLNCKNQHVCGQSIEKFISNWLDNHDKKLQDPKHIWEIQFGSDTQKNYYEVDLSLLKNRFKLTTGKLVVIYNITERKISEELIKHSAYHNTLTGLPNRKYFTEIVNTQIAKAQLEKASFALLYLDLDHFKHINDTYGHDIGDFILCEAAKRLKSIVSNDDTVARIGGDELTILLTDISDTEDVVRVAQNVLNVFRPPVYIKEFKIHLGTSIGISLYPKDGTDIQTLLKKADDAMYMAKKSQKGSYQLYGS